MHDGKLGKLVHWRWHRIENRTTGLQTACCCSWWNIFAPTNHECSLRIADWIYACHFRLCQCFRILCVSLLCISSLLWSALVISISSCFLHICLRVVKVVYRLHWFIRNSASPASGIWSRELSSILRSQLHLSLSSSIPQLQYPGVCLFLL